MSCGDRELCSVANRDVVERYGLCKLILGLFLELTESTLESSFCIINGPLKRAHRCSRWILIPGVVTGGRGWRSAYSRKRCDLILRRLELLVVEVSGWSEAFW